MVRYDLYVGCSPRPASPVRALVFDALCKSGLPGATVSPGMGWENTATALEEVIIFSCVVPAGMLEKVVALGEALRMALHQERVLLTETPVLGRMLSGEQPEANYPFPLADDTKGESECTTWKPSND